MSCDATPQIHVINYAADDPKTLHRIGCWLALHPDTAVGVFRTILNADVTDVEFLAHMYVADSCIKYGSTATDAPHIMATLYAAIARRTFAAQCIRDAVLALVVHWYENGLVPVVIVRALCADDRWIHRRSSGYPCDMCGGRFSSPATRDRHMDAHFAERFAREFGTAAGVAPAFASAPLAGSSYLLASDGSCRPFPRAGFFAAQQRSELAAVLWTASSSQRGAGATTNVVVVSATEPKDVSCAHCSDGFQRSYSDEMHAWVYRDATRVRGQLVHDQCALEMLCDE